MQLIIRHKTNGNLILPINYQHILQSIIYDKLREGAEKESTLHDYGYANGKRVYKLFQFSQIKGKYRIEGKKIRFLEDVEFEVRSIDEKLIKKLQTEFELRGISYGEQHYKDVKTEIKNNRIDTDSILIRMKAPITVHATDKLTKRTFFFNPEEERFRSLINDNFRRKYVAYQGEEPEGTVDIIPVKFSKRDKFVTNYKRFYITGWYGIYQLSGKKEYLDFLYQVGIGDRNSQGFGMFEEIKQ